MSDEKNPSELLTNTDLALECKVPLSTIQKWRHYGTGPKGFKLGKHVRYRREDVDAWIEQQERTA